MTYKQPALYLEIEDVGVIKDEYVIDICSEVPKPYEMRGVAWLATGRTVKEVKHKAIQNLNRLIKKVEKLK